MIEMFNRNEQVKGNYDAVEKKILNEYESKLYSVESMVRSLAERADEAGKVEYLEAVKGSLFLERLAETIFFLTREINVYTTWMVHYAHNLNVEYGLGVASDLSPESFVLSVCEKVEEKRKADCKKNPEKKEKDFQEKAEVVFSTSKRLKALENKLFRYAEMLDDNRINVEEVRKNAVQ